VKFSIPQYPKDTALPKAGGGNTFTYLKRERAMTQKPTYGDQTWKEPDNFMRDRIARLKELFPEIFTEGDKIDLENMNKGVIHS
jgi:hypothetical protein